MQLKGSILALALGAFSAGAVGQVPTTPAGSDVYSNVAHCQNQVAAENVMEVHKAQGFEAALDYIIQSPECEVGLIHFRVIKQLAQYNDLLVPEGSKTFYVIEAVGRTGESIYIISMMRIMPRSEAL